MDSQPAENNWGILKILAVAGDITSVTGISLLYLREFMNVDINAIVILKTLIAVSVSLGVLTFFIWCAYNFYQKEVQKLPFPIRFAYFTVLLPVVFIILLLFTRGGIEIINKMAVVALTRDELVKPEAASPTSTP